MSQKQRVFILLKPDCLERGLAARLKSDIISVGLLVECCKVIKLNERLLEVVYSELVGKHFYGDLRDFMVSGPSMAILASGPNAVDVMNRLKHKIRKENSAGWIDLSEEDIGLWELGNHPNQTALNIKLVAANLIHVCDSERESLKCAETILGT